MTAKKQDWANTKADWLTAVVSGDPYGHRNDIARALRAAYKRGVKE